MPYCTLEYSSNLSVERGLDNFFTGLHEVLAKFDTLPVEKIKSRAIKFDEFLVGADRSIVGFIKLEIAMFVGRSVELRKAISSAAFDYLMRAFHEVVTNGGWSVNVEIREIERSTFTSLNSK